MSLFRYTIFVIKLIVMKVKKKVTSLQVGEPTEETSPVAAIIEIDGMTGLEKFFF